MVTLFLKGEVKIAAFCTKEFDTFLYGKAVDDDDDDDDEATTTRRRRRGDDDDDDDDDDDHHHSHCQTLNTKPNPKPYENPQSPRIDKSTKSHELPKPMQKTTFSSPVGIHMHMHTHTHTHEKPTHMHTCACWCTQMQTKSHENQQSTRTKKSHEKPPNPRIP